MGLDVDVYARVVPVTPPIYEEEDVDVYYFQREYATKDEIDRVDKSLSGMDFVYALIHVRQWYRAEENVKSFRAGSYGGYNSWVNQLAKLAGYPAEERGDKQNKIYLYSSSALCGIHKGPFFDLICHSDCDGVLESHQCEALYKDFLDLHALAKNKVDTSAIDQKAKTADEAFQSTYFLEMYETWMEACRLASDGGCIAFH